MPSKWQHLKGRYPLHVQDDSNFVAKVALVKAELTSLSLMGLMALLVEREEKKDVLEAWVKELNVDIRALNELILSRWEDEGISSVKTDAGLNLHERIDVLTGVNDQAAWDAYLAEHPELEYMWSVGHQARNSFVKGLLDEGKDTEVPPCLTITWKPSVGIRKS